MRLFGLIGFPLGHSFSKNYFTKKFEIEGIKDCEYELFPIENIQKLPGLLAANPQLEGINVTIPYKKEVLSFLDFTEIPLGVEACNCFAVKNGKLTGFNTDIFGFEKSFREKWKPHQKKALVLGTGGAASAVIFVLKKLGINYRTIGRSKKEGVDLLYSDVNDLIIESHPIIINCTPLGTYPKVEDCPPISFESITNYHYLFDLVYNPAKTLFLQKGEAKGAAFENGFNMLVYQAEEAWRIWNREPKS